MSADTAAATQRFRVVDGSCLDCAGDVAGTIGRVAGVRSVEVFEASGIIVVEHDGSLSDAQVEVAGRSLGLGLAPASARPDAGDAETWWQQPKFIALGAGAALLAIGLVLDHLANLALPALVAYWLTILSAGVYPLQSAVRALRTRRLTISTLLVVAALGAIGLGVVGEAAMLIVVFSLGEILEDYVSDRARGSIRALMALAPPMALLKPSEGELPLLTPVESLAPGDVVVVRPGERLPTDGRVVAGFSSVDQSPITGESIPVEASVGAVVFGGTINGAGALEVEVTHEWVDTTLARIIRQVEEAQAAKGRAERFADRFGAVYTPTMFVVALVVGVVPPLLGYDLREWLYRALVVLTVSCSCALVISVPAAVISAISRAARDGILIKGGAYLERLASVRAIALDKTGTLTAGRPQLTDVVPLTRHTPEDVLRVAAAVEAASEHPLAGAVTAAARDRALVVPSAENLRTIPGVGVEAMVDGRRCFVGRPSADTSEAVEEVLTQLERLEADGKTAVVVVEGERPIGVLAVADAVRERAADVVAELHRLGIDRVVMLTGDNERTAAAIAHQVGVSEWRAGLLPEEKTAAIRELRAAGVAVGMVGDGVNDAPSLATADVGLAMGAAGTDVALETADVALMADDLTRLPAAIRLARRAQRNVRENVGLSLAAVGVLIVGALAGWLSLTAGLLLNEGIAILIIANGLRLLRAAPDAAAAPGAAVSPDPAAEGSALAAGRPAQWLVTVRAVPAADATVQTMLGERLMPLLAADADCREARVAACVSCAGEFTYSAEWTSADAVDRFERSPSYRAVVEALRPHLRTPPRRELWAIVAGASTAVDPNGTPVGSLPARRA